MAQSATIVMQKPIGAECISPVLLAMTTVRNWKLKTLTNVFETAIKAKQNGALDYDHHPRPRRP